MRGVIACRQHSQWCGCAASPPSWVRGVASRRVVGGEVLSLMWFELFELG